MKIIFVTTTINIPKNIEGFIENIAKNNHKPVDFIIIGDKKTPVEINNYLNKLDKKGCNIFYYDVEKQKEWLKNFPELDKFIPYNCVQRRNLAYLMAYENGSDTIITIDDDNFTTEDDHLGYNSIIGEKKEVEAVKSDSGWYNALHLCKTDPPRIIYPRGFPQSKKWIDEKIEKIKIQARVVINEGLVLENPDVDAMTHIDYPAKVISCEGPQIFLAPGTNCAINSQNTAYHKDLLPCMFLIVMGDKVNGINIGRYDDIWQGYFAKKIVDHMGDIISFGRPLVVQKRNPHNYLKDLRQELPGMELTEKLIVTLEKIKLSRNSYLECYYELIENLKQHTINEGEEYSPDEKTFFEKMLKSMSAWADACKKIMG